MGLLIVGHRGAMAHLPENSLASYALAEEIGVDEIELDVRLSKDEQLFLLHDATLDRTAADDSARGLGPASELTLAQLQAATLDSGRGVVTLAEMYDATHSFIQLEIKDPAVVPHLARFFEERPADAARTALTGFDADAVRHAAEAMPNIGRQIIVAELANAEAFDGGLWALLDHAKVTRFASGFPDSLPSWSSSFTLATSRCTCGRCARSSRCGRRYVSASTAPRLMTRRRPSSGAIRCSRRKASPRAERSNERSGPVQCRARPLVGSRVHLSRRDRHRRRPTPRR